MLNQNEFNRYCLSLDLSADTKKIIETIRNSPPSRRVKSWHKSISGTFPSRKMGVTIQFESHKNELPYIYELEHNPHVLEFYDQPPSFRIEYKNKNGKKIAFFHTADFFVLEKTKAYWVECKTENNLFKLAVSQPNRFQLENENWICPPGQIYAEQYKLDYIVQTDNQINWIFLRNIEFLDDYYRAKSLEVSEDNYREIVRAINQEIGITLADLIEKTKCKIAVDEIYKLICANKIFIDLRISPLVEPDEVRVFSNYEVFLAHRNSTIVNESNLSNYATDFTLAINKNIEWDGNIYRIINIGNKDISFFSEESGLIQLPNSIFHESVKKGKIKCSSSTEPNKENDEILNLLSQASVKELSEANRRYEVVVAALEGEELPLTFDKSERTLFRWINSYKTSEQIWGNGYLGLLPKQNFGNRQEKAPAETKKIINETISVSYNATQQKSVNAIYSKIQLICKEKGLASPCYRTVERAIKKLDKKLTTLKRQGKRAAYQHEEWHWELTLTTPRHGERPFHIAHLDHTELNIELIDSKGNKILGRVWLTLLVDAYSRRVLAFYISFNEPSKQTTMMIMRECVRRHGRLPQIIVVDGGKEFGSVYFETLLAYFQCVKKVRPPAEPRNGSLVERMFGVTEEYFIHNLLGNTQIMKNVRQVTKSVNPKNLAVWTFPKIYQYLASFFYEIYDAEIEHPALFQTPCEAFIEGIQKFGKREVRFIPYDEVFKIITLPPATRKSYKVSAQSGIHFRYINYFCPDFRSPQIDGKRVSVRYDPDDAGICYAYVNERWIKCYSEHYKDFAGKSWKEVKIATEELRKKKQLHEKNKSISAIKLARFLNSAEAEELLLLQRIKDREANSVRQTRNELKLNSSDNSEETVDEGESFNTEEGRLGLENITEVVEVDTQEFIIYGRLQ